jgi:RNA polymerase sigma-70 factor (ECF subfamily)
MTSLLASPIALDRAALERFRHHDPRVFERVVAATHPAAFGLARRICGSAALAEDAMQSAFLDVWRRASTYDPAVGSLSAWVMSIVRNRSIDTVRRAAVHERRRSHDGQLLDGLPSEREVLNDVIEGDEARTIQTLLNTLPPSQRRVIELGFMAGLSQSEIALHLGVPLGTVKSRRRLGLHRLRLGLDAAAAPEAGCRTEATPETP